MTDDWLPQTLLVDSVALVDVGVPVRHEGVHGLVGLEDPGLFAPLVAAGEGVLVELVEEHKGQAVEVAAALELLLDAVEQDSPRLRPPYLQAPEQLGGLDGVNKAVEVL